MLLDRRLANQITAALAAMLIGAPAFCTDLAGGVQQQQGTPLKGGTSQELLHGGTSQQLLHGSTSTQSGSYIQGGVRDSAQMHPAVEMKPTAATTGRYPAGVTQFSGGGQYAPGQKAPPIKYGSPLPASASRPAPFPLHAANTPPRFVAPPMYTMTPRNGTMSWMPGYQVTRVVPPRMVPRGEPRPAHSFYGGGGRNPGTRAGDGVMTWVPGYDVKLIQPSTRLTHSMTRKAVGGTWASAALPVNARGVQGKVTPSAPPPPPSLAAQAQLLPGLKPVDRAITWDQWYQRVANAIYDRWANATSGPGDAQIKVIVKNDWDLQCEVTSFTPMTEARDVLKETSFRESAVRAVNLVDRDPVLAFPFMSQRKVVTFDIDMQRSVNGPAGCRVLQMGHDTEKL